MSRGWSLGKRNPAHQPDRPVSDWIHDRIDGAEPPRRITAADNPDGYPLGSRTGAPKPRRGGGCLAAALIPLAVLAALVAISVLVTRWS